MTQRKGSGKGAEMGFYLALGESEDALPLQQMTSQKCGDCSRARSSEVRFPKASIPSLSSIPLEGQWRAFATSFGS